jgi:signal transduction histidine kinase
MTNAEAKLKERIKELTCLYEVTSIIVNSDYDQLETSLESIVNCLKKALQFERDAQVLLKTTDYEIATQSYGPETTKLSSDIKVFNKIDGHIEVTYPSGTYSKNDFLTEEQKMLHNVSLAVGNLLERKQIRDSDLAVKRKMEHTDRLHILGEITAGIAHELNTPLANILGFAELLKESVSDTSTGRDLEKIIDNAIFSREIVKKLMFFACEMPQQMNVVALNPIVENVLNLLRPALTEKKIELIRSFGAEDIRLRADTVQLTQVFFNLVMNAIYFSPLAGTIAVVVSEKNRAVRIEILDQGAGIDPKNADKIFEPFFTTRPLGEGSGLGLSVVHGIITSHKGSISQHPNAPKGTVFVVDFPKL